MSVLTWDEKIAADAASRSDAARWACGDRIPHPSRCSKNIDMWKQVARKIRVRAIATSQFLRHFDPDITFKCRQGLQLKVFKEALAHCLQPSNEANYFALFLPLG
jgi:hypothetical protein